MTKAEKLGAHFLDLQRSQNKSINEIAEISGETRGAVVGIIFRFRKINNIPPLESPVGKGFRQCQET